jgi:hypothetical protein
LGAGIYHQLHGIILAGKSFHGFKEGILNPAASIQIAERTGSIPPGIDFHFHIYIIPEKKYFAIGF